MRRCRALPSLHLNSKETRCILRTSNWRTHAIRTRATPPFRRSCIRESLRIGSIRTAAASRKATVSSRWCSDMKTFSQLPENRTAQAQSLPSWAHVSKKSSAWGLTIKALLQLRTRRGDSVACPLSLTRAWTFIVQIIRWGETNLPMLSREIATRLKHRIVLIINQGPHILVPSQTSWTIIGLSTQTNRNQCPSAPPLSRIWLITTSNIWMVKIGKLPKRHLSGELPILYKKVRLPNLIKVQYRT